MAYLNASTGAYRCRCDENAGYYTDTTRKICMTRDDMAAEANASCAEKGGYPVEIRDPGDYLCCPNGSTYRPDQNGCETQTAAPRPQPSQPSQPPLDWGQVMSGLVGAIGAAGQGGGSGVGYGGASGSNPTPLCQQYYRELQALGAEGNRLAAGVGGLRADEQAAAHGQTVIANSNRIRDVYWAAANAWCYEGDPRMGDPSCHYGQDGQLHCGGT